MVSEVIVNCSFSDVTNLTLSLSDGTVDIPPASTIGPKGFNVFWNYTLTWCDLYDQLYARG